MVWGRWGEAPLPSARLEVWKPNMEAQDRWLLLGPAEEDFAEFVLPVCDTFRSLCDGFA